MRRSPCATGRRRPNYWRSLRSIKPNRDAITIGHGSMVASAPILATKLYIPHPRLKETKMSSQKNDAEEHEQILRELEEQFGPLFEQSPVGVYLYVTDTHK